MKYWNTQINPVSGCTKASEACVNCYAEALHNRYHAAEKPIGFYSKPFNEVTIHLNQLDKFDKVKAGDVVFIGNMCDVFHDAVPYSVHKEIFESIELLNGWFKAEKKCCGSKAPTFIMLTKRPKNMHDAVYKFMNETKENFALTFPNLWLGVTAENQQRADERIPILLNTPAAHRWVSVEPMLGQVIPPMLQELDLVIAGGESGRNARTTSCKWFEDLYHECNMAGVRFYLKQWGDAFGKVYPEIMDDAFEMPWALPTT